LNTDAKLLIRRLDGGDADAVTDCFRRVYADSYGNPLFYETERLARHMRDGRMCCVGAFAADGRLIGHMGMTIAPGARVPELGNTVVDPDYRGAGIAWQVGAELTAWSTELGFTGFLHYPTASHHIMQRQSVTNGFETGVMLGYIPAETDGKVSASGHSLRQAATIVYQPLANGPSIDLVAPTRYVDVLDPLIEATGLTRRWRTATATPPPRSDTSETAFAKRGLARLSVRGIGEDIGRWISRFSPSRAGAAVQHLDFSLVDPAIDLGIAAALAQGFRFCGWLPGFGTTDVLRLQRSDPALTDQRPELVNPVARHLLDVIHADD
jgi:GNAT superfamily N-acetyltransferase